MLFYYFLKVLTYLFKKQNVRRREREKREALLFMGSLPQKLATARAGPDGSWEPGIPSGSTQW